MSGTWVESELAGGELVGYARAAGGAGGGRTARARELAALVRELTEAGCTRVCAGEESGAETRAQRGPAGSPTGRS